MVNSAGNSKKKPGSRSRPAATSLLSQAMSASGNSVNFLQSQFNPTQTLFALITPSAAQHSVKIFSVQTGSLVANAELDNAKVSGSICWGILNSGEATEQVKEKKKRRKSASNVASGNGNKTASQEILAMPLSNGTIAIFSPSANKFLESLSDAACTTALAGCMFMPSGNILATCPASNSLHLFSYIPSQGILKTHVQSGNGSPLRIVGSAVNNSGVWAASHQPIFFSETDQASDFLIESSKLVGHASQINQLACLQSLGAPEAQFVLTSASEDTTAILSSLSPVPTTIATLNCLAPIHRILLAPKSTDSSYTALLSSDGKVHLFQLQSALKSSAKKVAILSALSVVEIKVGDENADVIDAAFLREDSHQLILVRLIGGIKPVFEKIVYREEGSSSAPAKITVTRHSSSALLAEDHAMSTGAPAPSKYKEPESHIAPHLDRPVAESLAVDDDLAELALEDRIQPTAPKRESASTSTITATSSEVVRPPPTQSLAALLTQALHSSDKSLLETCLATSHQPTIRSTVRRLPSQLAVPLLLALMDRLSKGRNLSGWMKEVLSFHTGYLLSIPDLVTQLSALHQTITSRVEAHSELIALNGRLNVLVSQMELQPQVSIAKPKKKRKGKIGRYIESGDTSSSQSDEEDDLLPNGHALEPEATEEAGEIENIELAGSHSEAVASASGGEDDSSVSDSEESDEDDSDDESLDDFDSEAIDSEEEAELAEMSAARKGVKLPSSKSKKSNGMFDTEASEGSESGDEDSD